MITLRQQQKLIDSQESMLENQKEQTTTVKNNNLTEQAYKRSFEIFPVLVKGLREALQESACFQIKISDGQDNEIYRDFDINVLHDYFMVNDYDKVILKQLNNSLEFDVSSYGPKQFQPVHALVEFMNNMSEIDKQLMVLYDYYLSKDLGYGKDGWFYVDCYREFQIGRCMQYKYPALTRSHAKKINDDIVKKDEECMKWFSLGCRVNVNS